MARAEKGRRLREAFLKNYLSPFPSSFSPPVSLYALTSIVSKKE